MKKPSLSARARWPPHSSSARADPKPEILVFGAASLTESLQDLGKAYEAKTGQKVVFSFGASSDLARQIQAGAPADVFFSADTAKMDALEKAGLVKAADRREFLSNSLVVVVPADSTAQGRQRGGPREPPEDRHRGSRRGARSASTRRSGSRASASGKRSSRRSSRRSTSAPRSRPSRAARFRPPSSTARMPRSRNPRASPSPSRTAPRSSTRSPPSRPRRTRRPPRRSSAFLAGPEGRAEFKKRGFLVRDTP